MPEEPASTSDVAEELAVLIASERESLLAAWRNKARTLRSGADAPMLSEHIFQIIDELASALRTRSGESIDGLISLLALPAFGAQRTQLGFDLEGVVDEYILLRACIHELADEHALALPGKPIHVLNSVFDGAIRLVVQAYVAARDLETRQRAEELTERREEYLAFVAHDLRTPLNAISLATTLLEQSNTMHPSTDAQTARILKTLGRNVTRLAELVSRVLDENVSLGNTHGIELQPRVFDLWPLVEALVLDLDTYTGKSNAAIVNEVPGDLTIFADASLLRRVFQNLIANAIAYTSEGTVRVGARASDAGWECWVADDGAGIPESKLEFIFDKLSTDSEMEGGLGLGLAIVKTFVEAHDGRVCVQSVLGEGTTFRFTISAPH